MKSKRSQNRVSAIALSSISQGEPIDVIIDRNNFVGLSISVEVSETQSSCKYNYDFGAYTTNQHKRLWDCKLLKIDMDSDKAMVWFENMGNEHKYYLVGEKTNHLKAFALTAFALQSLVHIEIDQTENGISGIIIRSK